MLHTLLLPTLKLLVLLPYIIIYTASTTLPELSLRSAYYIKIAPANAATMSTADAHGLARVSLVLLKVLLPVLQDHCWAAALAATLAAGLATVPAPAAAAAAT